MAQDPYRYFRPEARNLLDQFAQGILDLEKNGATAGAVQRLLRLAHTLKGAARVVRQSAIAERAHAIEDALAPFRDSPDGIGRDSIDAILAHLDEISSRIVTLVPEQNVENGSRETAAEPRAKTAAATVAPSVPRVIRADIADMDAVLDGVSEAQTRLNGLRRSARTMEQVGHLADLLRAQVVAPAAPERSRPAGGSADQALAMAEELHRKVGGLANDLDTAIVQMD